MGLIPDQTPEQYALAEYIDQELEEIEQLELLGLLVQYNLDKSKTLTDLLTIDPEQVLYLANFWQQIYWDFCHRD